ncbi:subtilisin-like protease SBT3.18 [Tanacetum coccineum]
MAIQQQFLTYSEKRSANDYEGGEQLFLLNDITVKKHLMLLAMEVLYNYSNVEPFHLEPSAKLRYFPYLELRQLLKWPRPLPLEDERVRLMHEVCPIVTRPNAMKASVSAEKILTHAQLVGAHYYVKGYEKEYITLNTSGASEYRSPRDANGHGTHTASTAVGSILKMASFLGFKQGTARGGAPRGRLAVYKVFHRLPLLDSSSDIRSFHAMQKGISVVFSAGNNGPDPLLVLNVAPWSTCVSTSSIDRKFPTMILLDYSLLHGTDNMVNTFSSGPYAYNRRTHGNAQDLSTLWGFLLVLLSRASLFNSKVASNVDMKKYEAIEETLSWKLSLTYGLDNSFNIDNNSMSNIDWP